MTCHAVREHVEEFLDGELPRAVAAMVRAHLRDCPACAALVEHEHALARRLRLAMRAFEVPSWLGARIGAALAVELAMPQDRRAS